MSREKEEKTGLEGRLRHERLEALTEGVFAIAMTIMVLDLKMPEGSSMSSSELWIYVANQTDQFLNYGLSFVLLGIFWINHNKQFQRLRCTDIAHIWLNIGFLACISLVPYTTSLFDADSEDMTASALFAVNLFLIGFFHLLSWNHVVRRRLLAEDLDRGSVVRVRRLNLFVPAVSLVAFGLAFVTPRWSPAVYVTIPFLVHRLNVRTES